MTFNQGQEKLAKALLLPINPAAVVLLGIYTVLWGLWVANPFWDVFSTAPLFSVLSTTAPEVFWGCLAIFCGCITIYGAYKRRYRPLIYGAATAGWHWMMIAVFYFAGDWQNTGGITALIFCVYAGFVYLNIRVNHRKDRKSTHILAE
jgi:hypothetical protein